MRNMITDVHQYMFWRGCPSLYKLAGSLWC